MGNKKVWKAEERRFVCAASLSMYTVYTAILSRYFVAALIILRSKMLRYRLYFGTF